jgi:hypothetical protein
LVAGPGEVAVMMLRRICCTPGWSSVMKGLIIWLIDPTHHQSDKIAAGS